MSTHDNSLVDNHHSVKNHNSNDDKQNALEPDGFEPRSVLRDWLTLYAIVHPQTLPFPIEDYTMELLKAGVRVIQLRDKSNDFHQIRRNAEKLSTLTKQFGALLFINDHAEIADEVVANGVHLGPNDGSIQNVRQKYPQLLIGASAKTPEDAKHAEASGASYIGCGPIWDAKASKHDAVKPIGLQRLREVVRSVSIPVLGIGGVTIDNAHDVVQHEAAGVAVIRALVADEIEATGLLVKKMFIQLHEKRFFVS